MKYFWATRDRDGCCLWGKKPEYYKNVKIWGAEGQSNDFIVGIVGLTNFEDINFKKFEELFGITLKMNECKKVTIRLEEADK